ncbi:Cystathionine beta-lyase/cystathionine gamma-synthase (MetC) (PDB:1CL1) [Commensalibacter communis]|uniref:Cystathionine beta-lyase/cystathionine gamma-synthase (MetC) n=1 Tax=Commensalibacter communis TaxID=2972786 RepID=A0A9W4TMC0_9PROT|nr:cystathionine beta-lyase [Commensalibacter communis]CAI3927262.1 Cystathionine beta-lyase/cystathionine gamma-synthase (MetC) (PDB:1CL1) [Commensalibacter communis]CAI3927860.1 Cystathionine beta-lyase/cystathionine gamma-synthase (MetC) (PDB:1CL1) [Commensalibacter communis]CAI3933597.1 Cystathionine beta-lyase/cystathionine gamma-synthase (MetC) (PDB:1CL1) [Commensalibacter communis]CAI3935160.1 Cystathionine beta-lyase/cystathionine gamma-synthase (MetC) (PDB:1CL1) [Commensalibacter commu
MNLTPEETVSIGWKALSTLLVTSGRHTESVSEKGSFVNDPLHRGSTVIYPSVAAMRNTAGQQYEHQTLYGAMGSPNQHELEKVIALIEGGSHSQIVSSGLTACTVPLLAFLSAGDHCLLIDSIYGPTKRFSEKVMKKFGVEISYYPADISVDEIKNYIQPNTKVIFTESPGSHTFEIQDISALSKLAHQHDIKLFLDNTWGIGVFKPFDHGVDVSVQALTKYGNGHSDLVLGAITVNNDADWHILRDTSIALGEVAGPDACWLTLRGLRTLGARLEKQSISALKIAQWCQEQPEIERVLHPALPSCHGHEIWKRDFTGASSVFTIVFKQPITTQQVIDMIEKLKFFSIGASWGGYESLVLLTDGEIYRNFPNKLISGSACRLHIGLENTEDLITDLNYSFIATWRS